MHNSIKLINIERFKLTFQVYLLYFIVINTHHTTYDTVHDEVFGAKSMLQIRNLKLEPCITIQGFCIEFHSVCSVQQPGILSIRDVVVVWHVHV